MGPTAGGTMGADKKKPGQDRGPCRYKIATFTGLDKAKKVKYVCFRLHGEKLGMVGRLFLAHLSHWLMVSYCVRWMSVVRQTTSPPKLLAGF